MDCAIKPRPPRWRPRGRRGAQVQLGQQRIALQRGRRALVRDASAHQHQAAVGDGQARLDVLLHHQHGDAAVGNGAHLPEHLPHHQRRQAGAGFVEHQYTRGHHQRARHGQHLALPARQGVAGQLALGHQVGKARKSLFQPLAQQRSFQQVTADAQVLLDRQGGEDVGGLRHEADARGRQQMRRQRAHVLRTQAHAAAEARAGAGQRFHERGLAGAVGAQHDQDLTGRHLQARAVHDGQAGAVARDHVLGHQQRCALRGHTARQAPLAPAPRT